MLWICFKRFFQRGLRFWVEFRFPQSEAIGVAIFKSVASGWPFNGSNRGNARGTWVNSADDPDRCSFYLAATHRDGNVIVAVSTEGKSPALASHLRNTIAEQLPKNLADIAIELDRQRSEIKDQGVSTESINWSRRIREVLSPSSTKTRRRLSHRR